MHRLVKVPIYPMYLCDLFFADAALCLSISFDLSLPPFFFPIAPFVFLRAFEPRGVPRKPLAISIPSFVGKWKPQQTENASLRLSKSCVDVLVRTLRPSNRCWLCGDHRPLRLLEGLLAPGCAKKALGHFHTFFRWKVEAATDRKRKSSPVKELCRCACEDPEAK